jgi:transposase
MTLKTFSMDPFPYIPARHMRHHYPGGNYFSAYEAGFCGFWIHRELNKLGFRNIVVHPSDIPTTHKEKDQKTDNIDSRKLSRELEKYNLEPIYIPDEFHQQLRSLVRLRGRIVQNKTRVKNRIKAHLHFNGIPIPSHTELSHWSYNFIQWLQSLKFAHPSGKEYLQLCIDELMSHRKQLLKITRLLRAYCKNSGITDSIKNMCSVPGIGFVTAISFYVELIDINRFPTLNHIASYIGLVPSVSSSDKKTIIRGITKRRNQHLRHLIIEAAWVAFRKDPVLLYKFNELTKRMKKQEAIVRIAKKLLNRIRYVWNNGAPYCPGAVE